MSEASRIVELVRGIPWADSETLRVFWVRAETSSRGELAQEIRGLADGQGPVPLIIREPIFMSANALLSDMNRLIDSNRVVFEELLSTSSRRVNIVLLARDEFQLPQVSSPVRLPRWFPGIGGLEIHVRIADLFTRAESGLLNAEEARTGHIAELFAQIEFDLVGRMDKLHRDGCDLSQFLGILNSASKDQLGGAPEASRVFSESLAAITDRRAYRPSLKSASTPASRIIKLVLKSSPDDLGTHAKALARGLYFSSVSLVSPPMFAVLLRPTSALTIPERNAHTLMVSLYQAYQFLTGAAHAADIRNFQFH